MCSSSLSIVCNFSSRFGIFNLCISWRCALGGWHVVCTHLKFSHTTSNPVDNKQIHTQSTIINTFLYIQISCIWCFTKTCFNWYSTVGFNPNVDLVFWINTFALKCTLQSKLTEITTKAVFLKIKNPRSQNISIRPTTFMISKWPSTSKNLCFNV